jgi:tRNA threonylcarbamoyladenosine biosynthesis protein TsaE
MELITHSPEQTIQLGRLLGKQLQSGDILALTGELGSGKTCLTRGICEGLGVSDEVTSPTFVLINEYQGRLPVYHFDFYRLNSEEEIRELGIEDYMNGDGICIIEWAERGLNLLPEDHLDIYLTNLFENNGETTRRIKINSKGRFSLGKFDFS